jgi:hypothetical protein
MIWINTSSTLWGTILTSIFTSGVVASLVGVIGNGLNEKKSADRENRHHHVEQVVEQATKYMIDFANFERAFTDARNQISAFMSQLEANNITGIKVNQLIATASNNPEALTISNAQFILNKVHDANKFQDIMNNSVKDLHEKRITLNIIIGNDTSEASSLVEKIEEMANYTSWASFDYQLSVFQGGDYNVIDEDRKLLANVTANYYDLVHNYMQSMN